jgi:hypothetical protein
MAEANKQLDERLGAVEEITQRLLPIEASASK